MRTKQEHAELEERSIALGVATALFTWWVFWFLWPYVAYDSSVDRGGNVFLLFLVLFTGPGFGGLTAWLYYPKGGHE